MKVKKPSIWVTVAYWGVRMFYSIGTVFAIKMLHRAKRTVTRLLSNTVRTHSQACKTQQKVLIQMVHLHVNKTKSKESLDFWFLGEFSRNWPWQACPPRADKLGLLILKLSHLEALCACPQQWLQLTSRAVWLITINFPQQPETSRIKV